MTSEKKPTSSHRVEQLLERYGADPARFPEAERDAATEQIAQNPEFAELLVDAEHLDRLLSTSVTRPPSAELMRRIAEVPLRHPRPAQAMAAQAGMGMLSMIRAALAGLTATAFGVWIGIASLPIGEDTSYQDDPVEEFASLMFADDYALTDSSELSGANVGDAP